MIDILRKNKLTVLILATIFICGFLMRTVNLSSYPVGFQIDEASLGYNAYSILQTGKSEAGTFLPLYIDTFGDQRPTGYNYLTVPSVAIFGLTIFATRLPGAVVGDFSIFAIFLLSLALFKDKKIALLSSLLLAFSPWSIVLSRASAETIIALFFILLGFYFVLDFLDRRKMWELAVGTILLVLSFFFYHTPRVFVPLFYFVMMGVFFFPYKKLHKDKIFLKTLLAFILVCVASFILIFIVKGGTGRFTQVNIFGFPETKLVMQEEIREDGSTHTPIFETRMFHNKISNYTITFISNYFVYFSGDFLFMHGGKPIWYQVHETGLILLIECPFIIYGIYILAKSKNKLAKLPLFWIIVAPITASLTVDDIPNLQRTIVLFPMLEIIASVGVVEFWKKISGVTFHAAGVNIKYIAFIVVGALFIFNVSYFLHQYFIHGETHRTWYRNNGFQNMMNIINNNYSKYDKIVTTKSGGGYPLFLFFHKYSPTTYQNEGSPKDTDYKGFGKFIFVPNDCPSINSSVDLPKGMKVLYVDMGTCPSPSKKSGKKYVDIKREDGSLGFRVVY